MCEEKNVIAGAGEREECVKEKRDVVKVCRDMTARISKYAHAGVPQGSVLSPLAFYGSVSSDRATVLV